MDYIKFHDLGSSLIGFEETDGFFPSLFLFKESVLFEIRLR